MIVIFKPVPNATIVNEGKQLVTKVTQFFKDNPRRRICKVGVWYGKELRIKKSTIQQQIQSAIDSAIKK